MAKNKIKGFSVVEMLIVIAVGLILALLIVGGFSGLRDTQVLNGAAEEVATLINEARSNTLSSKDFFQFGVHFEASKTTLFKGTTFNSSEPSNKVLTISSQVEIYSIALNGGGSDVIFQKFTGKTGQYGVIGLRLKKDNTKTKNITITSTGTFTLQ